MTMRRKTKDIATVADRREQVSKMLKELRAVRTFLDNENSTIILSPRASITAAAHLAIGDSYETALHTNVYSLLSADQQQRAKAQQ